MAKKYLSHLLNGLTVIPLIWFIVSLTTPVTHLIQTSEQNVLVNTIEVV